jgi:hypothetical protein
LKPHQRAQAARRIRTPSEELADRLDAEILPQCHPWQRDVVLDPSRRIAMLCGRGAGKTTAMLFRALRRLVRVRSGKVIYCASSRPHAEELMWEPLKQTCERLGLRTGTDVVFHESKLKATFLATGATFRLFGIDDRGEVNKLRGQPFDEVFADEASIYPPELLDDFVFKAVGPRLGDRRGALVLGGTPAHIMRGLFYDATRPGSGVHRAFADRAKPQYKTWIGWSSHEWELGDVVALPGAAKKYVALVNLRKDHLEEKERNKWSDENPIWMREYRGKWAADNTENVFKYRPHLDGKPYNEWDPLGGVKGGTLLHLKAAIAALPKDLTDWRFVFSQDEGSRDPFACNVFTFSPTDPSRTIWHVFSFEQTKMYAKPIAELCMGPESVKRVAAGGNAEPYDGLFSVTGYPDAAIMDGSQPTIDELANVYGIQFLKADRKRDYKFGAIELTNGEFIDGRLKILKGSPLAQQLGELQWQEDAFGNLQENKAQANHSTDTLIYGRKVIAVMFENGTAQAPKDDEKSKRSDDPAALFLDEKSARGEFDDVLGGDDGFDAMFEGDGSGNYF